MTTMKYWVLLDIPYTGGDARSAVRAASEEIVGDRGEPGFSIGYPGDGTGPTTFRVTAEIETKSPLLALSCAIGSLRHALAESGQTDDWDVARAVIRVAPSQNAGDMYKAGQPVTLPHGYQGPMP